MLDVLKARWQTRGWHVMSIENSEPMALEFIKAFNRHSIPHSHYRELYERSADMRSRRMQLGMETEDFSADLMISCWPALRAELNQRRIDEGRTLTASAQSQCKRCFGTGMEEITRDGKTFVRSGCNHEMVEDAEETTKGFDAAINAVKREYVPESALDVIKRCQRLASHDYATAINAEAGEAAWSGTVILTHAERYVRDNPEF